jgi:uncharacterized protein (DUF927 family)
MTPALVQNGGGQKPLPMPATKMQAVIRQTVEVIHGSPLTGSVEVRVLDPSARYSGMFTDAATLATAASDIEGKTTEGNLYLTINPVVPRAQMNSARIRRAGSGSATGDNDVSRLRWIFLDFDPERPTGISATYAEKESARLVMEQARVHFAGIGWPAPTLADSGNGFHVLYPVDLPNDARARQLIKSATARASGMFSTAEVKLDVSVSNPARILRLWGTVNRKGEHTSERPWRYSALLESPERVPLTTAQLEAFIGGGAPNAGALPTDAASDAVVSLAPSGAHQAQPLEWRGDGACRFDMLAYLAAAGIGAKAPEAYNGGTRHVLDACIFDATHNRGEAAVFVDDIGRPGFSCFHDSCAEHRGWAEFDKKVRALNKDNAPARAALTEIAARQGYSNTPAGLFHVTHGGVDRLPLGPQLDVVARVRNADSAGWGFALKWTAPDGRSKDVVVSSADLMTDQRAVLGRLCDEGYPVACGARVADALAAYIRGATPPVEMRVDRPGWHGNAFVFPDEVIQSASGGAATVEKVHLASSGVEAAYNQAGTLDEWRTEIGRYCVGNSRLLLSASAAFAAPMLRPLGQESGGIHLVGPSSIGKSTALMVAGSICGGGGSGGYGKQWRATTNGLEGVAAAHNDGLLVLDELGQLNGREMQPALYGLANSAGKSRAKKDGNAAPTKTWSVMILSSGELSPSAHANESGQKVKAGAEVRLLGVPADAGRGLGLYEHIHGLRSPAAFSDHLKAKAREIYGTPLRAFLRWFVDHREYALRRAVEIQEAFRLAHVPPKSSGEIVRAAARFGLLGAAGELATEGGATGWLPGVATDAAGVCFAAWLDERGSVEGGDVEQGVRQVLAFIEEQGARFQEVSRTYDAPLRVGFVQTKGGTTKYLILRGAFEDILCKGHNYRTVRAELIRRELMIPGAVAKRPGQQQLTLPRLGKTRVYVMQREDDTFEAETFMSDAEASAMAGTMASPPN